MNKLTEQVNKDDLITESRISCPNANCCGGYVLRDEGRKLFKICTSCDGFGYLKSVIENRKRYFALRNLALEIELQSRLGRGLSPESISLVKSESDEFNEIALEKSPAILKTEHPIVNSSHLLSCDRIS